MQSRFKSPALIALALMTLPFVVGFDVPDTSGAYVRGGIGRGAYHVSGCSNNYDFEYQEAQLAFRKTFATGADKGWKPSYVTLGGSFDVTKDQLVAAWKDSTLKPIDSLPSRTFGFSEGILVSVDWKWVGFGGGFALGDYRRPYEGARLVGLAPCGLIRVGPEFLYASFESFSQSRPLVAGGGIMRGGIGGRWRHTRLWTGVGGTPYGSSVLILDAEQAFGPLSLSLTALGDGQRYSPLPAGIDQQYGLGLGLQYRIPGL